MSSGGKVLLESGLDSTCVWRIAVCYSLIFGFLSSLLQGKPLRVLQSSTKFSNSVLTPLAMSLLARSILLSVNIRKLIIMLLAPLDCL